MQTVIHYSMNDQQQHPADDHFSLISLDFIGEELEKHGLSEVIWSSDQNEEETLDVDFFLRLINCSVLLAEKVQENYIKKALESRRAAYRAGNWDLYAATVTEMSENQQAKHEEVLQKICELLNLNETQFAETNNFIN